MNTINSQKQSEIITGGILIRQEDTLADLQLVSTNCHGTIGFVVTERDPESWVDRHKIFC